MGSIADVVGGSTPQTDVSEFWNGDIPWITPNDLSGYEAKQIDHGERFISKAGYASCSTRLVPKGTVLFSSRAPIGYVAIASAPVCTNQGFKSFVPSDRVSSDYLFWYLKYSIERIREMASGTTFREISGKVAKSIPVVLAPMSDQHRIVEAIEEQFSRIDAGIESLQRAKRNLKRLRAAAVQSMFDARWPMVPLGKVTEVSGGIQKQPKRRARANAFPYLRVANVLRGKLDLTEVHEMELFAGELDRYRLELGDLLIVEGNGSASQIGRSARWNGAIENCVHQNHIIRARPGGALDSKFLDIYWNSPSLVRRVRLAAASTSGLYTLSTSKIKAIPVPVPSLIEQGRVVADIERQFSIIDSMAVTVDAGLAQADALRGAILARAFGGTLTRNS